VYPIVMQGNQVRFSGKPGEIDFHVTLLPTSSAKEHGTTEATP
jgi:hypothetical protein